MLNKIDNVRINDILRSALFGCTLAAGIGLSGATEAALAFSQPPANGNDAFSSISAEQAADDFSLASNGMINGISWWGSYATDPVGLPDDQFRISFFQDNGSGKPVISPFTTLTDTATRTATVLLDVTGETVYRYDLSVASPFALTGGTPYYLSVVNEFDLNEPDANWYWLLSDTSGSNYYRFSNVDSWASAGLGNLSFSVSTVVPLPPAFGLWLMGGVLIGVAGKIRKA